MSPHTPGPWYQHSARIERIIVDEQGLSNTKKKGGGDE